MRTLPKFHVLKCIFGLFWLFTDFLRSSLINSAKRCVRIHAFQIRTCARLTFASVLDADRLEASVEGGGIDDVRAEVPVVLPVDEERHHHRDHQAHDDGDDDAHIQSHVVCTGGHWRQ